MLGTVPAAIRSTGRALDPVGVAEADGEEGGGLRLRFHGQEARVSRAEIGDTIPP